MDDETVNVKIGDKGIKVVYDRYGGNSLGTYLILFNQIVDVTDFSYGTFCFSAYSLERPTKEKTHVMKGDVDKDVYITIKAGYDQVCRDRYQQLGL